LPIGVSDFVKPGYAAHVVVLVGTAAIRRKSSRRPGAWKAEMALADGDAEARELSAYIRGDAIHPTKQIGANLFRRQR